MTSEASARAATIRPSKRPTSSCAASWIRVTPRQLPELLGERVHLRLRLPVKAEVALVADDDGVGLVRVLIAHGARQLERQADTLFLAPHPLERGVDPAETRQAHARRRGA